MTIMFPRFSVIAATAAWLFASAIGATAGELAKPAGDIVLTISGAISNTNSDGKAEFDMDMLKALPASTFKTGTIWTPEVSSFTGVSLRALMAAVGATGKNMHSVAINDYAVEIPMTDAVDDGPIVAYAMDDKPMSVRDKGPLWVIYPFDSKSIYKTEEVYSRSIWQLSKIDIQN
jgi:hypothetical protein